MKNHYGDYNGRVIIHGFLQFILMFGEGFAKVFNSAMYVLLGFLIYKHTVGRNRSSVSLFLGIYILMWFFLPQFGAAVLWLSGGANYVWASCIVLAALLPYRLYFEHISTDKQEKEKARYMWIIPLGFIGGSTSENIGGAVALAMLAAIVIYRILDIKIPKWSIAGFFSAVLGYVFLLLGYGKHQPSSKTDFMGYIDRLKDVFAISGRLYLGLLLVLVTVLILALTFGKREDRNRTQYIIPIWYIAIAMAAVGVMTFSVQRPDRAWFFSAALLICAIGWFYLTIRFNNKKSVVAVMIAAVLIFTVSFTVEFIDINNSYKVVKENRETLYEAISEGNTDSTIGLKMIEKTKSKYNPYNVAWYVDKNENAWINMWIAKYYNVKAVKAL